MSDARLDVEFNFNTSEATSQTAKIQEGARAVGEEAKKTNTQLNTREGILERLRRRMAELRNEAAGATSVMSVARLNRELGAYEAELLRVSRAGRAGFDDTGAAIQRTEGLLERLQRAAALYQKGMFEATRPENIEKYRQKLAQVNNEVSNLTNSNGRSGSPKFNGLQNSINQISRELPAFANSAQTGFLAISNNIPILVDEIGRLKDANAALNAEGQKGKPIWKQLIGSLFSWGTALSLGVTLLTVYGKEIGSFIGSLFKGKPAIDQAKESIKQLNKAFESTDLQNAVKNVDELKIHIDLAKKGFLDKKQVVDEYNQSIGKTTGKVSNLDAAEKQLAANSEAYVKMTLYKAAANLALEEAAKKSLEAEQNRLKKLEEFTIASDKRTNGSTSGYVSDFELAERNQRALAAAKKRKEDVIKVSEDAAKAQEGIAKGFLTKASDVSKKFKFDFFGGKYDDKKIKEASKQLDNAYNQIIESRKGVLNRAATLDAQYARKKLTSDEQEVQAVRDKYAELRGIFEVENAKIRKFNSNPKNKIKVAEIDTSALKGNEDAAVDNVIEKQSIAKTKAVLNEQKELYAAYEVFKNKLGSAEADKRFANDLKGFKNYTESLQSEIAKIELIPEVDRSGNQKDFLAYLQKQVKQYNAQATAADRQRYEDAYTAVVTSSEKIAAVHKKYADLRAQYEKIADKTIKKNKFAASYEAEAAEIDTVTAENFAKTELFRQFNAQVLHVTREGLRARIDAIKKALVADNILPPELRKKLQAELAQAEKLMSGSDLGVQRKQLLEQKKISEAILKDSEADAKAKEAALASLTETNAQLRKLPLQTMGKIAEYAQIIGASLQNLGQSVSSFDEDLGDTVATAGQLVSVIGNIAGAISSGNAAQIIGALIDGIATLFTMSAAAMESERKAFEELRKHREEVIQGELEYNRLLRERQRTQKDINDMSLQDLKNQEKELQQQLKANELRTIAYRGEKPKTIQGLLLNGLFNQKEEQLTDYDYVLKRIQQEGLQVTGQRTEKYGGLFGLFQKTRVVDETQNLVGKTYDELEKLYTENKLTDATKTLFENLKKAKDEVDAINAAKNQVDEAIKDKMTNGLKSSDLLSTIQQGIKGGKKLVSDFADDINETVQDALLSALSAQVLEQPLADLVKKFREDSKDGLSAAEIAQFKQQYNSIVQSGLDAVKDIETLTGKIGDTDTNTSISGRINRNVSEDTASAILGFERSRYDLSKQSLSFAGKSYDTLLSSLKAQEAIAANTANTVSVLQGDVMTVLNEIKNNTGIRVTR